MPQTFRGIIVLIYKVIDKRGFDRYYRSRNNKPLRRIRRVTALRSIARIRSSEKRRQLIEEHIAVKETIPEETLEGELAGKWFVGKTSQPAPTGYIIVQGAFPREMSDPEIFEHAFRTLGMSFQEYKVVDFIPANYTYIYDLEGNNYYKV